MPPSPFRRARQRISKGTPMDQLIVCDTTLRDGEQAPGCHLGSADKLQVAWQLQRLGVDIIEAGFPASSPGELEAVRQIAQTVGQEAPEISGFARCVEKDIDQCWEAVRPAKRPRLHLFLATSDIHLQHKLRMTREDALSRAVQSVRYAKALCSNVQFSPEDASRTDRDYLATVLEAVIDAGATTINIPDTVGYAIPEEFAELITFLFGRVRHIGQAVVSVHCHDDLGLSVANALSAVRVGARQVECTINGIGERAGNSALEEIVMAVRTRPGIFHLRTGIQTRELAKTSRLVSTLMGMTVQANKAIIGANAFAHASGVHQDGMLKNPLTYEILKPEDVGVEESKLLLTARSGRVAVAKRLAQLGHALDADALAGFFERFKTLADKKRYVYDDDLLSLIDEQQRRATEQFTLVRLQYASGSEMISMATVCIRVEGVERQEAATGDGPVAAVYLA